MPMSISRKNQTDASYNGPLISFIIAVYNNERYLVHAIDSITSQNIPEIKIEIIIIDDGSTDNTGLIADNIAENDSRIRVIHQSNQWIYASFNNGIKEALGEYIYILNSDDKLYDGAINILVESINKYDHPDVIWTKVTWQDVNEHQIVIYEKDMNPLVGTDEYYGSKELVHKKWPFVFGSGVAGNQANLYKRQLAINHPFRNDYYGADAFFNLGIADDVNSMAFISKPIYKYLSYGAPGMNASVGKYYGYEHKMFNELMMAEISLCERWGILNDCLDYIVRKRLQEMYHEIEILMSDNCMMKFPEKLIYIFKNIADCEIRKMAIMINTEREYESRILTGTGNIISKATVSEPIPEFIQAMIGYLPNDYREDIDISKIDRDRVFRAIYDKDNIDNVGKIYFSQGW